jgi:hypothetical protein
VTVSESIRGVSDITLHQASDAGSIRAIVNDPGNKPVCVDGPASTVTVATVTEAITATNRSSLGRTGSDY